MKRLIGSAAIASTLALQACLSSSLVLQVAPDGHGRAIITSRLYEQSYRAFEQLFSVPPAEQKTGEDMLAAATDERLSAVFGTRVTIESSALEKTEDGLIRKTIAAFADITQVRLMFPPVFDAPGHGGFGMSGVSEMPVITFAMRPHENGDRLLVVQMPDTPMDSDVNPAARPEPATAHLQQQIKAAIKGMRLAFAVELEVPLLRTNAPAQDANRATILDVDVAKLVDDLDDAKMARVAMGMGSIQQLLWAVGDAGGGLTPLEREIVLEFQPPASPAPAAPAPAPRPDTEIFLASLRTANGDVELGAAVNITNSPGYDNQPCFTPDGRAVLFTSARGDGAQTDIYRYDLASGALTQITRTPESEYSPTITPSGDLSVVRVEQDKDNTQRLWRFTLEGGDPRVVLDAVKPVGYHAWLDDHTVALYVLGRPATLQIADTRTGTSRTVASDVARSLHPIPGGHAISFVQHERSGDTPGLAIMELSAASGQAQMLTRAVPGGDEADVAWTPDGTLLMARGATLYAWRRGRTEWTAVADLERLGLKRVTRIAVSPAGDRVAFVSQP